LVLTGQEKIDSCKITYSQQFEYSQSIDKSGRISKAKLALENILHSRDVSLMFSDQGDELVGFIHEELFPSYLFDYPSVIEFHFLNTGETKNGIVFTLLMRQSLAGFGDEYRDMLYIHYIYRAILVEVDGEYKLNCSLRIDDFQKKNSQFGRYLYNQIRTSKTEFNVKEYRRFSGLIFQDFGIKPPKEKLIYVVSDRNDAMKIFGFEYSLNVTGMYLQNLGILINCTSSTLDKHELTHYFLKQFGLSKFLSEGIAVYYGGSQGFERKIFFENQKLEFKNLEESERERWLNLFKDGQLTGGPYSTFFYAISGQLIANFIDKNGKDKLSKLVRQTPNITPEMFIQQYLISANESVDNYLHDLLLDE
jgi:hypothetical protein